MQSSNKLILRPKFFSPVTKTKEKDGRGKKKREEERKRERKRKKKKEENIFPLFFTKT